MFTPVFEIFSQTISPHLMGARTLILANSIMHFIIKFLGIGFSLILNNVKTQKSKRKSGKKTV
jgi:hypothetical protein